MTDVIIPAHSSGARRRVGQRQLRWGKFAIAVHPPEGERRHARPGAEGPREVGRVRVAEIEGDIDDLAIRVDEGPSSLPETNSRDDLLVGDALLSQAT